jgi:hypothetical protein
MTTTNNQTEAQNNNGKSRLPTHIAKVCHGHGKGATYEQIGIAWVNDNGSLYIKLHGTQIVSAFTLYEVPQGQQAENQTAA